MHPFSFCLAWGPLAIYLVLVGSINLRRRALVVTGSRESAALGLALIGFVLVGPMQLFAPDAAVLRFGWLLWPLLLTFYGLALTLWLLTSRPRLVIFNITASQLRPILAELALRLDPEARWAGDSLALPHLGVQLRIESLSWLRNVVLASNGDAQSFSGWRHLERMLRERLRNVEVPLNPRGVGMVAAGTLLLSMIVVQAIVEPAAVAQGFLDMLHL